MKAYCPKCGDTVSDEQCPHWDYESDPRVTILPQSLAGDRRQTSFPHPDSVPPCPTCGTRQIPGQCPLCDKPLFRVSYTYNYPSPAGPYRGKENRERPLEKGTTFRAAFGLATVTSCRKVSS